jgi:DNA adenine methylase
MMQELQRASPTEEEVRETFKKAPFGWPGGKWRSLQYLLPLLPLRKSYIETCGGSGIVLLNRPKSPLEVFNDRFSGVTDFYRCLADPILKDALADRLGIFIHSRELFIEARDTWKDQSDPVERAARWFYSVKTSFGSIGRNWGRSVKDNDMVGAKLLTVAEEFPWIHNRIRRVQFDNLDVVQCIKDYANEDSVIYIDPDYPDTARGHYECQMDFQKHNEIIEAVFSAKGFIAVSGYPNELYDGQAWDEVHTWQSFVTATPCARTETNYKKNSFAVRDYATEVLYIKDFSK